MANIKLKDAIKGKKTITYVKKQDLWARKCDCCGLIFKMEGRSQDSYPPSIMHGIFSQCATGKDGRGLGNMFEATVCSFACADKIFKGGWENMSEYIPYKKEKAHLEWTSLYMTSSIKTEEQIIKEWKNEKI
jgi:hypothetical protein